MNEIYEKIVLISIDSLRADCINRNPAKLYTTEYHGLKTAFRENILDKIVDEGIFFSNCMTAAPYTSASHGAIFTGLWPRENGLFDQFNTRLFAKNIFELAKEENYRTIFNTDFPIILGKYLNLIQGVEHYFSEDADAALNLLKDNGKALAFFHFGQVHYPYGFHKFKYAGNDYLNKIEYLETLYQINFNNHKLIDIATETFRNDSDMNLLYRYKSIIHFLYSNKKYNELFDLYLEGVDYFLQNFFDAFFTKLVDILSGKKYVVIILSDHGETWNDNSYGHHNSLDVSVLRVPVIFYGSNIQKNFTQKQIRTIDIAPTISSFMGCQKDFSGEGLENYIFEKQQLQNRIGYSQIWLTNINDIVSDISSILDGKEMRHDKQLCLYKEAVSFEDFLYEKQYYKIIDFNETLKPFSGNRLVKVDGSNINVIGKQNKLFRVSETLGDKLLLNYSYLNSPVQILQEADSTSIELRDYLKSFGYRI